jgi:hypothetical protein
MGHGNFSESIGVISNMVKMLMALFRVNICAFHPCMPLFHLTLSAIRHEPHVFLVHILWCPCYQTPSVMLTFSLHMYSVPSVCRAPMFYYFHSFHCHTIMFPTVLNLNLPAHLLVTISIQLLHDMSNSTPFSRPHITPRLPQYLN